MVVTEGWLEKQPFDLAGAHGSDAEKKFVNKVSNLQVTPLASMPGRAPQQQCSNAAGCNARPGAATAMQ